MKVIITPRLCRAARALLEWQQQELAAQAGVSLSAVKAFEAGSPKTREKTQEVLQKALENHGVEFPASGGVRTVDDVATITRYTGAHFIHKWNEDIFQACTNPKQDMLTSSIDEKFWTSSVAVNANAKFLLWVFETKQSMKSLIPEGQADYNLPRKSYRTLPREMLGRVTYTIYADRIAFVLWKKKQVIVIRNTSIVETFRSQFDYLWKLGRGI